MSYASYDTQDRKHRSDRHRDRESRHDRPIYREDEIVEARTGPRSSKQMDLVRRREDSVEEVERDFPPGDGYVRRSTRRARSDGRGRYDDDDYGDDRRRSRRYDDRRSHGRRDYSSSLSSESPPRRRKSLGEQALAALGVGGALGAAKGHRSRSRDRGGRGGSRRRRRSYSSSSEDGSKRIQQAVKAALTAGAAEAFRSRKEPGGWGGPKGRRVLTAAIGAGGIDGLVNKDSNKGGTRHAIESVIGGLASTRILNGSRDKDASRSRSRSRVRQRARSRGGDGGGGLKGLAAGGLAAAAGKALLDARSRSKSRGRRSYSSSDDSRSPRRSKKRSKSVSDYVSQGMAALGLAEGGKDKRRDDHRGSRRDRYDPYYEDDYTGPQQGRLRGGGGDGGDGIESHSESDRDKDSSSDEVSSSEEERTAKKMRGKEYVTAGLASVATIHAAHSVYKSIDNRKKRSKLVKKGEMSPEESHKLKNKARFQDAAAIGIAALGIKGAVSEWKEMNEQRVELREFANKRVERHEKRLHKLEEQLAREKNHRRSAPDLNQQFYESGPTYQDGNPYHTGSVLPPPPMGPQQAPYY